MQFRKCLVQLPHLNNVNAAIYVAMEHKRMLVRSENNFLIKPGQVSLYMGGASYSLISQYVSDKLTNQVLNPLYTIMHTIRS